MELHKQYKLREVLAIKIMINNTCNDVLFLGIYRPSDVPGPNYYSKLEKELNLHVGYNGEQKNYSHWGP